MILRRDGHQAPIEMQPATQVSNQTSQKAPLKNDEREAASHLGQCFEQNILRPLP